MKVNVYASVTFHCLYNVMGHTFVADRVLCATMLVRHQRSPGAVQTYNNVSTTTLSTPTITAEINFKQTLATTYNYHCSEQCVPTKYRASVRGHSDPSIMVGSFRIARDTIAMICWSYASLNIEINIHLRFLSIIQWIWCEWFTHYKTKKDLYMYLFVKVYYYIFD